MSRTISSRANAIAQVIGESSSQRTFGRKTEPSQIVRTFYLYLISSLPD
jgi:hypothetical protein